MHSSKTKAAALQRPSKFNFLSDRKDTGPSQVTFETGGSVDYLCRENGDRRYWPIGTTSQEAKRTIATKSDLKKLVRGAK